MRCYLSLHHNQYVAFLMSRWLLQYQSWSESIPALPACVVSSIPGTHWLEAVQYGVRGASQEWPWMARKLSCPVSTVKQTYVKIQEFKSTRANMQAMQLEMSTWNPCANISKHCVLKILVLITMT